MVLCVLCTVYCVLCVLCVLCTVYCVLCTVFFVLDRCYASSDVLLLPYTVHLSVSRPPLNRYAAGWLRPQETHTLAVRKEIVTKLPERLQELLGWDVAPPFIGYVDGRHPKRTLRSAAL